MSKVAPPSRRLSRGRPAHGAFSNEQQPLSYRSTSSSSIVKNAG
jgi:hypothetical protein